MKAHVCGSANASGGPVQLRKSGVGFVSSSEGTGSHDMLQKVVFKPTKPHTPSKSPSPYIATAAPVYGRNTM